MPLPFRPRACGCRAIANRKNRRTDPAAQIAVGVRLASLAWLGLLGDALGVTFVTSLPSGQRQARTNLVRRSCGRTRGTRVRASDPYGSCASQSASTETQRVLGNGDKILPRADLCAGGLASRPLQDLMAPQSAMNTAPLDRDGDYPAACKPVPAYQGAG